MDARAQSLPHASRRALLVRHEHPRFGIVHRRQVEERHVNIFLLGPAIFDQRLGDALRDFALLVGCSSLDPGDLHVRHQYPPGLILGAL